MSRLPATENERKLFDWALARESVCCGEGITVAWETTDAPPPTAASCVCNKCGQLCETTRRSNSPPASPMTPEQRAARIEAAAEAWIRTGVSSSAHRSAEQILDAADRAVPVVPEADWDAREGEWERQARIYEARAAGAETAARVLLRSITEKANGATDRAPDETKPGVRVPVVMTLTIQGHPGLEVDEYAFTTELTADQLVPFIRKLSDTVEGFR